MQPKILLIALSVAAFSSCSTAYKSGQTPDDVYYSPVRLEDGDHDNDDKKQDEVRNYAPEDNTIRMRIRDRRWRNFDEDYSYNNSPYHYCTCNCNNYGYYYNPKYYPWPVYLTKVTPPNVPLRTVNLSAYSGYSNNAPVANPKAGTNVGINWIKPTYNTPGGNVFGNTRQTIAPSGSNSSSSSSSSSSNNTRTYSPSTEKSSSSSSSSSSGSSSSSSSSSVSRPKRD